MEGAQLSISGGRYEWACFQAEQSGEKALKAFLYGKGYTSILTHSIRELLRECITFEGVFGELEEAAGYLDAFYLTTRYPDSLVGNVAPADYYTKEDAQRCQSSAELILKVVKSFFSK